MNATQDVQQQYYAKEEARDRIGATQVVIDQATEALRLSQERYRAGLGTALEITDAEQTLANARSSHVQAEFDYRVAHVKLLSAMGVLHE